MVGKATNQKKDISREIQEVVLEMIKQNILLGQRLDTQAQRYDAVLDRMDRRHEEYRKLFGAILERLGSVEKSLAQLPDAVKDKIGFSPRPQ